MGIVWGSMTGMVDHVYTKPRVFTLHNTAKYVNYTLLSLLAESVASYSPKLFPLLLFLLLPLPIILSVPLRPLLRMQSNRSRSDCSFTQTWPTLPELLSQVFSAPQITYDGAQTCAKWGSKRARRHACSKRSS